MVEIVLWVSLLFVALACLALTGPAYHHLRIILGRIEARIDEVLTELFMFNVTPRMVTFMSLAFLAACIMLPWLLFGSVLGALIGAVIGMGFPLLIIWQMVKRRRATLETQLLDGLITLANGMRAGLNLGQAIGLIEEHGEKPLSQEFGLVNREVDHGTSIDVALDNAGIRLKSHNYRLLFAAMRTTRVRGGNMPETLDRLGESLREIVRLEEKVKAQTAQGRTSAIFMGAMPLVVLGIYYLIDNEGINLLFSAWEGHLVLLTVLILNVWGFLWIRKVVSFEI